MKKTNISSLLILLAIPMLLVGIASCSDDFTGSEDNKGNSDADSDGDSDGDADGDSDGDGDGDADDPGFAVCGEVTSDMTRIPTRVMLLLDRSGSMNDNNKWGTALSAIDTMVNGFDEVIAFGLDLFSHGPGPEDAVCWFGDHALIDVEINAAGPILFSLEPEQNMPSTSTPLYLGMQNYTHTGYAPIFQNRAGDSYLVVISDGQDTCGTVPTTSMTNGATASDLGTMAETLLSSQGIKTIVIGFGSGADPGQLNAIAAAGGSPYDEFINATDGNALSSALQDIAQTVAVSCMFQLGTFDEDSVNLDLVNVTFDNKAIPRDDDCKANQGWSWTDDSRTAIEFCDAACRQLENDAVQEISVKVACSADDVIVIIH